MTSQHITAGEVVLSLLNVAPRPELSMHELLMGGRILGIGDSSMRVSVSRLTKAGRLIRPRRGHYALSPQAQAIATQVRQWRERFAHIATAWDGRFVQAFVAEKAADKARDKLLYLLGFRRLMPRVHLRPNNLDGGVERLCGELAEAGVGQGLELALLCEPSPRLLEQIRALYDMTALNRGYAHFLKRLSLSHRALSSMPKEEAMAESFLLGREVIRFLTVDPRLPSPWVRGEDRRALVAKMVEYNADARPRWLEGLEGSNEDE